MQETQVQSLSWDDPLEKGMAPTLVFLPGKSYRQRSLVGYSLWGCKELDRTEQLTFSLFVDVLCLQQLRNHLAFKFFLSYQRQLRPNINSTLSYLTFKFKKKICNFTFLECYSSTLGTLKDQNREVIIRSHTEEKKTLSYSIKPQQNCTQPYTVLLSLAVKGVLTTLSNMECLEQPGANCKLFHFGCYPLNRQSNRLGERKEFLLKLNK